MNIKKFGNLALVMALSLGLTACGGNSATPANEPAPTETTETTENADTAETTETADAPAETPTGEKRKIAVLLYDANDAYIASVRQQLEALDAADDSIELVIQDGQKNQGTQTDQLNNVIAQGVDGILLNIVDVSAAPTAMDTIKAAGIPTVFFNRDMTESMSAEDLENFLFVGTDAPQAGVMQGELVAELWENGDIDRNGNGVLDYVMLNGGIDNPEAKARTEYSVSTLKDKGIEVNELAFQDAQWKTDLAKTAVDAWLQKDRDNIDVVLANNDAMAIGAISSLQGVGMNTGGDTAKENYIVVVGVDATDDAKTEIQKGTMAGTVKQDAEGMAKAAFSTIKNKLAGNDWLADTDYELGEDGKSVRINYQIFQ